jgi:undecaprenyl diphosphate synthase
MTESTDSSIPHHVAIIPDGNRRWAKQRGLGSKEGHKAAYDNLKKIAFLAFERGISHVTGYAFSTENWSRGDEEVGYLMNLLAWVIKEESKEYHQRGIRLRVLGSQERLDPKLLRSIKAVEEMTRHNTNGTINICLNYGGRRDLVEAMRQLTRDGVAVGDIDEARIAGALSSHGLPDPDLIIRTSGEQRLSNFLIWEGAYSELYFTDTLWPDFDAVELDRALAEYALRERNFGK